MGQARTATHAPPATRRRRARRDVSTAPLLAPAVGLLLAWMVVPLAMTLWFSVRNYNLTDPTLAGFAGLANYRYLLTDPDFWSSLVVTLELIGWALLVTVGLGTLLAVLYDQEFPGRAVARLLVISPFFVMPTVAALLWKNLLLHPIYGVLAAVMRGVGLEPVDWFAAAPLSSVVAIVSWEWLPFAVLILLTAVQSLDAEQKEAARMDGAGALAQFVFITLPHLRRAIGVVVMVETIFLLTIFAEIFVTTSGGPGTATTDLAFLIYSKALLQFDVGGGSAGGVCAIVLANVVAFFLVRSAARTLDA